MQRQRLKINNEMVVLKQMNTSYQNKNMKLEIEISMLKADKVKIKSKYQPSKKI